MNKKTLVNFSKMFAVGVVSLSALLMFAPVASATGLVTVSAPAVGAYWRGAQDITWSSSGTLSQPLKLSYSSDFSNWSNAVTIPAGTTNVTSPFQWNVSNISDGTYKVRVTGTNGTTYGTSATFNIDNTPPTTDISVSPATPNGLNGWYTGTAPTITLTCSDPIENSVSSGCSGIHYAWYSSTSGAMVSTATTTVSGNSASITALEGDNILEWSSEDSAVDKNLAHNISATHTQEFKVDTAAPTMTVSPAGGSGSSYLRGTRTFTFTANDPNLAYLEFSMVGPSPYTSNQAIQTMFAPNSTNPLQTYDPATGVYTPYTQDMLTLFAEMGISVAYDSSSQKWTMTIDTTKKWTTSGWSLSLNPWAQPAGTSIWPDGQYTFTTGVGDFAGNALTKNYIYNFDNTAPVTTLATTTSPASTGWYNHTTGVPTITLTCTDNLSSCSSIHYSWYNATSSVAVVASTTVSATPIVAPQGDNILIYYSEDNAVDSGSPAKHNVEVAQNAEFKVNTHAPTISSYTLDGNTANAYFNPGTMTLKLKADEPVDWVSVEFQKVGDSSIHKIYYPGSPYDGTNSATQIWDGSTHTASTLASDGIYNIQVHIKDAAGNETTEVLSPYTVTVDTTDPVMTISSPTTGLVVHNTSGNVDFNFTATDTNLGTCAYKVGSGSYNTISCTSPKTLTLNDGRQTVTFKATDLAGNTKTDSVNFVVDTDGTLTVNNATSPTSVPDFKTIQGAIDAAVTGITTIDVAAGNYPENVTISKSLILDGANSGTDPNSTPPASGTESIISPASGTAVTVASDGVTIDGFTITNDGSGTGTGISSSDHSGLTIQNNIITNIGNGNDDVVGRGIEVVSASAPVDSVSISNNLIENITSGESTTGTVSGGTSASAISIGWFTSGTKNITGLSIKDNVITGIKADTTPWTPKSGGGWLSTDRGYGAYGILINHKTTNAKITGNIISGLDGYWAHAIGLEGNTPGALVTGNTISNLTSEKTNPTDAVGVTVQDNSSASSIKINENTFDNATVPAFVQNQVSNTTVDATNNYYGTAVYSKIKAKMQENNGGSTSAFIKFTPYYVNNTGTGGILSNVPVTDVYVNGNYPTTSTVLAGEYFGYNAFATIQNGVDATALSTTTIGTVHIVAGTYAGDVTISKSLSLDGAQKGVATSGRTASGTGESVINGLTTVSADNVSINGFTITNPGGGVGITVPAGQKADNFSYNIFNNITSSNNPVYGISIGGTAASTGIIISNNAFNDIKVTASSNPYAIAYGIYTNNKQGAGLTVTDNTFSNLEGFGTHAIGLEGPTLSTSITGNTFSLLSASATDQQAMYDKFGIFFQSNPDGGSVTVSGNKFEGSKTSFGGIGVSPKNDGTAVSYTVQAQNNWWGDATGPYSPSISGTQYLNPNGLGVYVSSHVDFNPFYNSATSMIAANLVSSGPIDHFVLSFSPNSVQVKHNSILTVTAKDAGNASNPAGYTVVNSTTKLALTADGGASFGATSLTMGALGATTTTITSPVVSVINPVTKKVTPTEVMARDMDSSAYGTGTIIFTATPVIIPTITVKGGIVANQYTLSGAGIRFANGLQFDVTKTASYTVTVGNGIPSSPTAVTPSATTITAVSKTNAPTLGLHSYTVTVTSSTGNTVSKTVTYNVNANPALAISNIQAASVNATTTTITWTTSKDATSQVEYGTSSIYGSQRTTNSTTPTTTHSVTLSGLTSSTIYHFRVISTADSKTTTSGDNTFATGMGAVTLNVTGVSAVPNASGSTGYAVAGGDFAEGWRWDFQVTVPVNETSLKMKFDDFTGVGGTTIPVMGNSSSNLHFYSAQAATANTSVNAIAIGGSNAYSAPMILSGDAHPNKAGRQVDIIVEMRVPTGTAGGSYSTSYGIDTTAP